MCTMVHVEDTNTYGHMYTVHYMYDLCSLRYKYSISIYYIFAILFIKIGNRVRFFLKWLPIDVL